MNKKYGLLTGLFLIANCANSMEVTSPGEIAILEYRLSEAEAFYQSEIEKGSNVNDAFQFLSRIQLMQGKFDEAIEYSEKGLDIEPNVSEEYEILGDAYCSKAQNSSMFSALKLAKKCIAHMRTAISLDPNNIRALVYGIGFNFEAPGVAGGSKEEGQEMLETLKKVSPEHATIFQMGRFRADDDNAAALKLADELSANEFATRRNQYEVARFYKDNEYHDKATPLFESLISSEVTLESHWYVTDAHLQLAEILLATKTDVPRSIELINKYKSKNQNPRDPHYYWSTWSLAKAYAENGNALEYKKLVKQITSEDYKDNKAFAKRFKKEEREISRSL